MYKKFFIWVLAVALLLGILKTFLGMQQKNSRMAVLRTQVFTYLLKQCENFIESKNTAYKNISFEIYFEGPFNFS